MHPTTAISLFLLIGITTIICLLALLFPNKIRKIIWIISFLVFIVVAGFYSVRPFIVENQTVAAKEKLNNYLEDKYSKDNWKVTDTNEYRIKSKVILHVIFESEKNIVYEYVVNDTTIEQIDMWTKAGNSVYGSGMEPEHYEPDVY